MSAATDPGAPRRDSGLLRILGMSRYAVGIAVIGTFAAATALLVYGAAEVVDLVSLLIAGGRHATERVASPPMLLAISAVDAFLVAIVIYVIALGFYQLFFHPLPLPSWLVVDSLEDLELELVGVVISALSVVFLGLVVTWDGQRDLQGVGIAVALVIGALAYFIGNVARKSGAERTGGVGDDGKRLTRPGANASDTEEQTLEGDSRAGRG